MVLRGAQFQRSGRVGCALLTRRVLPSYTAVFGHGWCEGVCLPQRNRITRRYLIGFHGRDQYGQPHEGLASYDASE